MTILLKLRPLYILLTLYCKSSITLNQFWLFNHSKYIVYIIVAILPTIGKFLTDPFDIKHLWPYDKWYIISINPIWFDNITLYHFNFPQIFKFGYFITSNFIFFLEIQKTPKTNKSILFNIDSIRLYSQKMQFGWLFSGDLKKHEKNKLFKYANNNNNIDNIIRKGNKNTPTR